VPRLFPWLLRGLWVALPFTAGPALADALHPAATAVRTLASVGLWAGWAAGTVAVLVPHPVFLTGLRILAPAAAVAALAAVAVGLPVAALLLRSLHALSRRWVVFVPAGVVLHDHMTLADPVLVRRQAVRALGPASPATDALDLTQRALGLVLELALAEPVALA